jgi:hypothetical protein
VNRRMEAPSAHTDDAPKLLARILKGVAGPPWQVACAHGTASWSHLECSHTSIRFYLRKIP